MNFILDFQKNQVYIITAWGWKKINALRNKNLIGKQTFIAMQFGDKNINIIKAFKKAVTESGFKPKAIIWKTGITRCLYLPRFYFAYWNWRYIKGFKCIARLFVWQRMKNWIFKKQGVLFLRIRCDCYITELIITVTFLFLFLQLSITNFVPLDCPSQKAIIKSA